jgi:hypothetical protein
MNWQNPQKWMCIVSGTLFLSFVLNAGGYVKASVDSMTTVPQLVRLADVIGIGTATNCTDEGVILNVSSYWLGNPGSNKLYLSTNPYGTQMPTLSNGVSVVFFATTNLHIYLSDVGRKMEWNFNVGVDMCDWNYPFARTNSLPSIPLSFVGSDRAVFNIYEDEGNLTLFASNLVQCMRIQPNVTNYYELVRITSYQGRDKRVKDDKIWSLLNSVQHDSLPMIELMAADTNLPPFILNWAKGRLNILNTQ